MTNELMTF